MLFDTFYWYQGAERVEVQYEASFSLQGLRHLLLGSGDQIIPPDRDWFPLEQLDQNGVLNRWHFTAPKDWRPRNGVLTFADVDGEHEEQFQRLHISSSRQSLIYTLTDGSGLERPYVLGKRKPHKGMRGEKLLKLMAGRQRDHMRFVAALQSNKILTWEADIDPVLVVIGRDYYKGYRVIRDPETREIDLERSMTYSYINGCLRDDVVYMTEICQKGEPGLHTHIVAAPFQLYIKDPEPIVSKT